MILEGQKMKKIIKIGTIFIAILLISTLGISATQTTPNEIKENNIPEGTDDTDQQHPYANPLDKSTSIRQRADNLTWNCQMNISAGSEIDFVIFGEHPDASDGPPRDSHDVLNPPLSPGGLLDGYLDDGLLIPYDKLTIDARSYPDTSKTWNFTITYYGSATITLTWNPAKILASEYSYVNLTNESGTVLVDMLNESSHEFDISYVPVNFHIECTAINADGPVINDQSEDTAETGDDFIINASITDDNGIDEACIEYWFGSDPHQNVTLINAYDTIWIYDHISIPTDSLEPLHYIIKAKDIFGSWNQTAQQNIPITDGIHPNISNVQAQPSSILPGETINITAEITDNIQVDTVLVNITDPTNTTSSHPMNLYRSQYYYENSYTNLGSYSFLIYANDTTGNIKESNPQTFTVAETEPPEITDTTTGPSTTGDSLSFSAMVTDDFDTPTVYVEYWYDSGSHTNMSMTAVGENNYEKTITVAHTTEILYYIISANDTVPKWNNTGVKNLGSVIDNDHPNISFTSGDIMVGTGENILLWVTANDNINVTNVTITIDSINYAMAYNNSASRWEYQYTAPLNDDSDKSYSITVFDAASNNASSSSFTIDVFDDDQPQITQIAAIPMSVQENEPVNISCMVQDNIQVQSVVVNITDPNGGTSNTPLLLTRGQYYLNQSYTTLGLYTYHIYAEDTNNNHALSDSYTFDVHIIPQHQIFSSVGGNWSLISLPFNQSLTKAELLIKHDGNFYSWHHASTDDNPTGSPIVEPYIFGWNRSSQSFNIFHIINKNYSDKDVLHPGYGYWIYAYEPFEFWTGAINPTPTNEITTISKFWNLFGIHQTTAINVSDLIIEYQGIDYNWTEATTTANPTNQALIDQNIFYWSNTNQQILLDDKIQLGLGYWMFAYQECLLKHS